MSVKKSADAALGSFLLEEIILERYLLNVIPKNRKYTLKEVKKITGYNFTSIRDFLSSDLFTIHNTSLIITDNNKLLQEKSKLHCEQIIKKLVFPSLYKHDHFIYNIDKLYDSSYYTQEEKRFIDLMLDSLLCLISDDISIKFISHKDLLGYYLINSDGFNYAARDIFNAIIQKEIQAGNSIMPYIARIPTNQNDILNKITSSSKYDYFFDKNAILKCDLETNVNVLIKNFLNLVFYNLSDMVTKTILLSKLNSKFSFLIKDKIFDDFE